MGAFFAQPGFTTTALDLANALEPLRVGLVGLLWLFVAIIVLMTIRELLNHPLPCARGGTAPTSADRQKAA